MLTEFQGKIILAQTQLNQAWSNVVRIVDEAKNTYTANPERLKLVTLEYLKIEQEQILYAQWFDATLQNLNNLLSSTPEKPEEQTTEAGAQKEEETTTPISKIEEKSKPVPRKLERVDIRELLKKNTPQDAKESSKLYETANQELAKGNYETALETYQKSIELDKNNYKAMEGIAKVYIQAKEFNYAIKTVNVAIDVFKAKK